MRIAIITPYHTEKRALLFRCISSVRGQSIQADHFMIADGHPNYWIDGLQDIRHIRLDRSHGDAGNAARAVGCLLAITEDYDAIGLLDADNWLEYDHVAVCIAASENISGPTGGALLRSVRETIACDYVVAKRTLRRPDESVMPLMDNWPFDTNCLFFLRSAFKALPYWAMIPKEKAGMGDRVFYQHLRWLGLKNSFTDHATVNYHNLWAASYRALGEPLPPGAKESLRLAE